MIIDEVEIKTANLDHHGLIAAICHDVDLIERINKLIGSSDPRRVVSPGEAVVAMILNGLGFANRRLYLTPQFFESKPIERLLRKNFKASDFDDHALGKALDEIAEYGPDRLFGEVAFEIAINKNLLGKDAYTDTTSYSTNGEYSTEEPGTIDITYGYSKDKRPDLKQVMMSLVTTGSAQIPIWMQPLSGNSADSKALLETAQRVQSFQSQLKIRTQFRWVMDAAAYSANNLIELKSCLWIIRVPERIKEASDLLQLDDSVFIWQDCDNGYKVAAHESQYAGIRQRWIIVFSQQAYLREITTLQRNIQKTSIVLEKKLWHLKNKLFTCEADATQWMIDLKKQFPLFSIIYTVDEEKKHIKRGRPNTASEAIAIGYVINATHQKNEAVIANLSRCKGRFIIATNDFDSINFTDKDVLIAYKEQQQVERGFRFLKDPWFMLDTFFLKTKRRVAALMAVMTLCLLIYNLAQHTLRQSLFEQQETIPDQKGKSTTRPTMRWVFQLFEGISIIYLNDENDLVSNLTQLRIRIIRIFGDRAKQIYGIT